MINVLLVDDHEIVLSRWRNMFEGIEDIKVIGECHSGEQAHSFCCTNTPDVVIMDMDMPAIGGLAATKKINSQFPNVKILVMSLYCDELTIDRVQRAGATTCLSKSLDQQELVLAVKAVRDGKSFVPSSF